METKVANPTALGLFGFGVTTILLSLANLGQLELSIVIIAVAIVLGGFAEIFAGLFELKLGNTFAGTVFVSFGLFWLSLVLILLLPELIPTTTQEALNFGLGVYLLIFALYSLLLFIDTLKSLLTLKVLLLLVLLLFLTLGIFYVSGIGIFLTLGGIVGVIAGLLGVYMCTGMIINEDWGEEVFKL